MSVLCSPVEKMTFGRIKSVTILRFLWASTAVVSQQPQHGLPAPPKNETTTVPASVANSSIRHGPVDVSVRNEGSAFGTTGLFIFSRQLSAK